MKYLLGLIILLTLVSCEDHELSEQFRQHNDYIYCMEDEIQGLDFNTMTLEEKQDSSAICRAETGYDGRCYFAYDPC